jgi:hypothetical protein
LGPGVYIFKVSAGTGEEEKGGGGKNSKKIGKRG